MIFHILIDFSWCHFDRLNRLILDDSRSNPDLAVSIVFGDVPADRVRWRSSHTAVCSGGAQSGDAVRPALKVAVLANPPSLFHDCKSIDGTDGLSAIQSDAQDPDAWSPNIKSRYRHVGSFLLFYRSSDCHRLAGKPGYFAVVAFRNCLRRRQPAAATRKHTLECEKIAQVLR